MPSPPAEPATFSPRTAAFLAVAVLVIHIVANLITPYEFHRDEFLYVAMGDHLRLWRMDFPPFIALVARASHALFHESIPGIRLAPAFSHAALVYCAAFAASLFGARRSAQMLAGLSVALCPLFMRAGALFQPVTFDQLWWTLTLLALAVRIRDNDPKHWIGIGVFLGLGALTKFSIAFLVLGFAVAVLATGLRRDLLTRWPWMAVGIATVIGHPSITGQLALGWPVRQQMEALQSTQLARVGGWEFLAGQLQTGPVLLLGIAGMIWLWESRKRGESASRKSSGSNSLPSATSGASGSFSHSPQTSAALGIRSTSVPPAAGTPIPAALPVPGASATATPYTGQALGFPTPYTPDWRPLAIACATAFLALLFMHGKAYYIGPIYPMLAAAGAVALQQLGERIAPRRPTKVLAVVAAAVALYGMVTLPFGLPVLEPREMEQFARVLGSKSATETNTGEQLALPQDYADMLGWQSLTSTVVRVWNALPAADTAQAILIATNYGRAGALDLLGRPQGLPPVVSPAGSYWFFGPGNKRGDVAVIVADDAESLKPFYRDITDAAVTNNPWGVPEEQSVHVYVCRGAVRPLSEVWPSLAGRN